MMNHYNYVPIEGTESLECLLILICESHELADMHLRMDERRCLNLLNRNNAAATIRFPMKGKISTRQMKLNCIIQAVLGCLSIPDPSLNQEAMKIMRIADRVCKCLVTYVTRPDLISQQPQFYSAVLNSILLGKCVAAHLWENSPYVSKQLKGIGPTFSTLLASAGKVNFMLLEESHPRDLERIMNKGPPAGNVLRKQVSLLPKYQLTMIPVDEKTVTVQLVLLNQSHLAENMDSLTAGDGHKSYIIVGDSDNNLLLLAAFKDRDLISVFDGTIAHEVTRKHNFEHKIFAHCISSTFVGIDVQSEYSFNDLEPFLTVPTSTTTPTNAKPPKKTLERQTSITDTFKERKRKINPDAIEKSKEKRKRENAIIENFKYLKQSFETASKNVSQSLNQQSRQNKELSNKNADACSLIVNKNSNATNSIETNPMLTDENTCSEDINSDDFIDEEKIDSILNEIENEMTNTKISLNNTNHNNNAYFREKSLNGQNLFSTKLTGNGLKNTCSENKTTKSTSSNNKTLSAPRKTKAKTPKSNYNFIELLERKLSISDDEDKTEVSPKNNGFSDTIKNQIQEYLTKTQTKTSIPDRNIKMLLNKPEVELLTDDEKEVEAVDLDCEILNSPTHSTYPRYEIKEILGDKTYTRQNSYKQTKKGGENQTNIQDSKICDSMTYSNNIVKHSKNIEVDTTHCDTDKIITLSLDDKDPRKYSDNELQTDNLNDTLILNVDETSEMFANQENVNREVEYSNEKDVICVEEYNFKNENIECRNNVVSIDPDLIMISPTEVSDNCFDTNNKEINNQHSVEKERNITTEGIITEGKNNNPSYVVVDNKELQNLCDSTITDATGNYLYTDTDIQNGTQVVVNDKASHKETLAIDDVSLKAYEPTTVPDRGTTFHENILAIHDVGSNYYQSAYKDEHLIQTGKLALNNHHSDIVLQNTNQLINRAPHDPILANDNIDSNFYQPTKMYANNNCLDIVQKNSNQIVENNRVSHDKILEMTNVGFQHNESPKVHDPLKISSLDLRLKSKNEKEINKKRLHEKTLVIKDSGRNVHPDQAQHNNSICLPSAPNNLYPSYSLMNHDQNNFSNPSKNLTESKQNHEFVKRYMYSTSKVDMCTKQTPEYCVHVIKKVKMDLDITAIVSRKQNSSHNYETGSEEAPSSNKRMKIDVLLKQDDAAEESNKIIATVRNEMMNTSKVNLPAASRTPRPKFTIDNSVIMEPDKVNGEKSESNILKTVNENNICESLINENQTEYDNEKIPEVRQEELKGQDDHKDNYEKTSKELRELETVNSSAKGENNIKNILHKYSKILAKNAVKAATPSSSGINRTVIGNSKSTTKSQKPFKITDINKLHAALPETIVDNKSEVEKYISQFPKINRYVESKKKREELNSNQYTDFTETAPIEEIPEYDSISVLDLDPIHLPANEDLKPFKDYKIDQSMFDPKTLLQTVADDDGDEIVPPPPEFCDGITYSSNYENGEASIADEYDKLKTPQNDFFADNYMEYNESIFDDCSATNLTPSTEIETWNLSQEDSWDPCNAINLSPVKSFTVMRRNTMTDCFSQNNNLSRHARLAAFRLNQKSKLKIRK